MSNDFDNFHLLPVEAQKEAIREGEERVKAQLTVANNADQRALNWGRMHIASATAAFGATLYFLGAEHQDYWLAGTSFLFGILMAVSGWFAVQAARPDRDFHLPGNTPANWLPDPAHQNETEEEILVRTRREQAECLRDQITNNAKLAKNRGEKMNASYEASKAAVVMGGFLLGLIGIVRIALSA